MYIGYGILKPSFLDMHEKYGTEKATVIHKEPLLQTILQIIVS